MRDAHPTRRRQVVRQRVVIVDDPVDGIRPPFGRSPPILTPVAPLARANSSRTRRGQSPIRRRISTISIWLIFGFASGAYPRHLSMTDKLLNFIKYTPSVRQRCSGARIGPEGKERRARSTVDPTANIVSRYEVYKNNTLYQYVRNLYSVFTLVSSAHVSGPPAASRCPGATLPADAEIGAISPPRRRRFALAQSGRLQAFLTRAAHSSRQDWNSPTRSEPGKEC